jgi:uncharacterized peroxidase-related enzyme
LIDEGMDADVAKAQADACTIDWRDIRDLSPADTALCEFAEKATDTPGAMGATDVEFLRAEKFTDTAIHDATQVIAYFNYINRVADCLGVDTEPEMGPRPRDW